MARTKATATATERSTAGTPATGRVFSFEFFPPRNTEAEEVLHTTWAALAPLQPHFFSVTFGADGSTREGTCETAQAIQTSTGIETVPHISCIGTSKEDIRAILQQYQQAGVRHIVALRGDLPSGAVGTGELRYGNELVEFIREETGRHFYIEVAAYPEFHPQASSVEADLQHFKRKIEAGADSAITQYFYNPYAYYRFIDNCQRLGISAPIVPGIMPIISCTRLSRFSEQCGAEIPRWILKRLQEFGDDRASIRAFGVDVTTELCAELLENGAPGLHFYTLNRAASSLEIWKRLGLGEGEAQRPDA